MPDSRLALRRRRSAPFRRLRAIWRDTSALWSEFRIPILLFILLAIGGGWFYGELYFHARGEVIPMIDRPYLMLQLMILETPENAPAEWYLVIFWYLLPVALVFIIGLGAADFLHLFFHRGDRPEKWREALASTFRNHFIVFGAGHVGLRVIRELGDMGMEVIVIDNDPDPGVEAVLEKLHMPIIIGDGRETDILQKAGLKYADSFVACTGDDHINLEVVMKVRELAPEIRIVARMWDNQISRQMKRFMGVQTVLSSSDLAAPAFAGAALGIEITQTLSVNGADYSTVRLVVQSSFLAGKSIGKLQEDHDMDIVLYCNDEENIEVQPPRDTVVKSGDTLVIFAEHNRIIQVAARNHLGAKKKR